MKIIRIGSVSSERSPASYFTGAVRVDSRFKWEAPSRLGGGFVTFEPGARTAWHSHPAGQTLFITAGFGRVQRQSGPIEEVRAGDLVYFEPGEKHWHGASPTTAMTHLAIVEESGGRTSDWMEHVTDEEYDPSGAA